MITEGSLALKQTLNPRQAEMEEYLSAEGGYWIKEDVWRTDAEAYKTAKIRTSRREGVLADFTGSPDTYMKLELKYFLLSSLKNQWRSPAYVQDVLMTPIRLVIENAISTGRFNSFSEVEQDECSPVPEYTESTVVSVYSGLLKTLKAFFVDYYDDREETEKLQQKLRKNEFDLNDFLGQLKQMSKLGGIEGILKFLPGGKQLADLPDLDPKEFKRMEAIMIGAPRS